jgi:hypothetical protein
LYLRFAIAVLIAFVAVNPTASQHRPEQAKEVSDFLVDVSGPDTIVPGDLAVFSVGNSTATKFAWTLIPSSKNFRVDTSLRLAYLSGASGTYTIVLVGTDSDNVAIDTQTVTITGTPIPVPPGPGPTPPGPTPEPSGPLAKQMASWLSPLKGQVTKQQLLDVAANYEAIAAEAVATQGTMTKDGFVAATQTQNVRVLGPQTALAMRDPFFVPLAKYMNGKKLAVDDESGHAALWREVGAALTEVSKSW